MLLYKHLIFIDDKLNVGILIITTTTNILLCLRQQVKVSTFPLSTLVVLLLLPPPLLLGYILVKSIISLRHKNYSVEYIHNGFISSTNMLGNLIHYTICFGIDYQPSMLAIRTCITTLSNEQSQICVLVQINLCWVYPQKAMFQISTLFLIINKSRVMQLIISTMVGSEINFSNILYILYIQDY